MRQLIYGMMFAAVLVFLPLTAKANNQQMVESVAAMLESSELAEGCDLGLKYQNQTIWLTGTVPSEAKKMAIEACVFHVKGVEKVVNNLEVVSREASKQVASTPIVDEEVQAAAFQRSILCPPATSSCPPKTQPLPPCPPNNQQVKYSGSVIPRGERIISDELVSVQPITNPNAPALPVETAPAVGSEVIIDEKPVMMPGPTAGNSASPMRTVNYTMEQQVPVSGSRGVPLPINSPAYSAPRSGGVAMRYDQPHLPRHAWPSYASYPNTAAVQYPKKYCAQAWPYIGPFYPYPQVPDGWRKCTIEWHDGYWHVNFDDGTTKGPCSGLFRMNP